MSGDRVSGDRVSGDRGSGDRGSGDRRSGDRVSGDRVSGDLENESGEHGGFPKRNGWKNDSSAKMIENGEA